MTHPVERPHAGARPPGTRPRPGHRVRPGDGPDHGEHQQGHERLGGPRHPSVRSSPAPARGAPARRPPRRRPPHRGRAPGRRTRFNEKYDGLASSTVACVTRRSTMTRAAGRLTQTSSSPTPTTARTGARGTCTPARCPAWTHTSSMPANRTWTPAAIRPREIWSWMTIRNMAPGAAAQNGRQITVAVASTGNGHTRQRPGAVPDTDRGQDHQHRHQGPDLHREREPERTSQQHEPPAADVVGPRSRAPRSPRAARD